MGNKIVSLVTTVILLLMFLIMMGFMSADRQNDNSKRIINDLTQEIQYKGYITYERYLDAINKIPYGNMMIRITHIKKDDFHKYKNGTLDMRFMSQIMGDKNDEGYETNTAEGVVKSGTLLCESGDVGNRGIYKFEVGDQVQVDLVVMESTLWDNITGVITGRGTPGVRIIATKSGVIVNAKY